MATPRQFTQDQRARMCPADGDEFKVLLDHIKQQTPFDICWWCGELNRDCRSWKDDLGDGHSVYSTEIEGVKYYYRVCDPPTPIIHRCVMCDEHTVRELGWLPRHQEPDREFRQHRTTIGGKNNRWITSTEFVKVCDECLYAVLQIPTEGCIKPIDDPVYYNQHQYTRQLLIHRYANPENMSPEMVSINIKRIIKNARARELRKEKRARRRCMNEGCDNVKEDVVDNLCHVCYHESVIRGQCWCEALGIQTAPPVPRRI